MIFRQNLVYTKRKRQVLVHLEPGKLEMGFVNHDLILLLGIQMTEEEAVLLIQRHERARQCRLRAQFMKNIRELKDRSKVKGGDDITETGRIAALKIQRAWRGFITRRKIRKRVLEEMLLIGASIILTKGAGVDLGFHKNTLRPTCKKLYLQTSFH